MIIATVLSLSIGTHIDIITLYRAINIDLGLSKARHINKMHYFRQITNGGICADIHVAQSIDARTLAHLHLGLCRIPKTRDT